MGLISWAWDTTVTSKPEKELEMIQIRGKENTHEGGRPYEVHGTARWGKWIGRIENSKVQSIERYP